MGLSDDSAVHVVATVEIFGGRMRMICNFDLLVARVCIRLKACLLKSS